MPNPGTTNESNLARDHSPILPGVCEVESDMSDEAEASYKNGVH